MNRQDPRPRKALAPTTAEVLAFFTPIAVGTRQSSRKRSEQP
jgi:hypothetical protein